MAAMLRRTRDNMQSNHNNKHDRYAGSSDEETDEIDESGMTVSDEEEDEDREKEEAVTEDVLEDIQRFETHFHNISQRYRLINRIGEGTFSTVYKAEDLLYDVYANEWDETRTANDIHNYDNPLARTRRLQKSRFVAIKKIYVTSSPQRIFNELELLHDLREAPNVCPLITAMRCMDQVVAILPFFPHTDFREYYRDFSVDDMRVYFVNLFTALRSVHEKQIIHRDIKPTNFLYSPEQKRGVLVDFGLAEREGTDFHICPCIYEDQDRIKRLNSSVYGTTYQTAQATGQPMPRLAYPVNDQRPSRRANRAGTRGFRAPEVLLKCTAQTTSIDVWSCGIILLTFLSHRFPFYHSADDIDAFIELCCTFGKKRMKETALLHGQVLHTNIPSFKDSGQGWESIVLWCKHRTRKNSLGGGGITADEAVAIDFMSACLELDPSERITARDALKHPFLTGIGKTEDITPTHPV